MDNRIKVRCLECGKKWKTASSMPQCSRCNSVDVEPAESMDQELGPDFMSGCPLCGLRRDHTHSL